MSNARPLVLVVDDHRYIRDALVTLLRRAGYATAVATNGLAAQQYLMTEARPTLILLDITMPVMDGWAFLNWLRWQPELSTVPVVVLTGGLQINRHPDLPVTAWVNKPFRSVELLALIGQHL